MSIFDHKNFYGVVAEYIASFVLMLKGYVVLCRRFKTPVGEIDIIAKRGVTIVFVEVKYRKTLEDALFSLSNSQRERIRRASLVFMKKFNDDYKIRFDVIACYGLFGVSHIQNAF